MKNKLIELGKENDISIEIYERKTDTVEIDTTNDKIDLFQIMNVSNYQIKAIKDEKCITFSTNGIDDPIYLIENINTMFKLQENDNKNTLSTGNISNLLRENEELDYNLVKKDLTDLYQELKSKYKELSSVQFSYLHNNNGYYIDNVNSKLEDECFYNVYSASIAVKKDDVSRITYFDYYSKKYDILNFKKKVFEKVDDILIKLDSDSCKTEKYNIILKNNCVATILGQFVDMFDSKLISQKESILSDKFNEKIFSDKINIIEDPDGENTILKRCFDTEGVKTYYKDIVKDGVFVKKINNLEYAIKNNEEPTGNAYGVNNLYVKPGNIKYNELVKELNNGIIIDEVQGIHAGTDKKNGNISLQAEGLLVRDGKIVKGLNMILIATNLFEIFTNVVEVGNDLSNDSLAVRAPSLLLKNITITGKN